MKPNFWFYIEPYVYLACKADDCLFYNTLTGRRRLYWNDPQAAAVARRLLKTSNMRVIGLGKRDLENGRILELVENLREEFMGDVIDVAHSRAKPALMPQRAKIQKDVRYLKKTAGRSVGEGILEYLSEVSIHINAACREQCPGCRHYCTQFLCCTRPRHGESELSPSRLAEFFDQVMGAPVSRVNILGGNILLHSRFGDIIEVLKKGERQIVFFLHYLHLANSTKAIKLPDIDQAEYCINVTPPYAGKDLAAVVQGIGEKMPRTTFVFVVQSDEDIREAETLMDALEISRYRFRPFFDGENRSFFRKHVFLDLEDIFASRPTLKQIYANMTLDRLHFGRLIIRNNGAVHAHLNAPRIGTLGNDSIHGILYREMHRGRTWRKTRSKATPCRGCVLSDLCPPLGSYEVALKDNALCHVNRTLRQ
jgi:pseudo-rSAM protein